jgi:hypothetical protein
VRPALLTPPVVLGIVIAWLSLATTGTIASTSMPNRDIVQTSKVLTIVVENHSYAQMRADMPYLNGLADRYGYANNWSAITHPSEPNYLAMVGGSTFGITDDRPPSKNKAKVGMAKSVFDQALNAGLTAKTYAESMTGNCGLSNSGLYAVRHNPWTFFGSSVNRCSARDVPMLTTFTADAVANRLPNAGMLIPNLCHDAHERGCNDARAGKLVLADNWLRVTLPAALRSRSFMSGRLTIVVTADEGAPGDAQNKVLTVVLNAALSHVVVSAHLTHYSLCRYYAQVLGTTPLRRAAEAPNMRAAFGL